MIDIHVNTEVPTTGMVIPFGMKRSPAVVLTQWCKKLSKVPGLLFNSPDARFVYIRLISDAYQKRDTSKRIFKII